MNDDLKSRVAIVTGGARGIGLAIVEALAADGLIVHAIDMAEPEGGLPEGAVFHKADITDPAAVTAAVGQIGTQVSVLVNNAGITRDRTLMKMSDAEWSDVVSVNLTGAFNMMRAVAPLMAGRGAIINVTSINGLRGKIGQANYSASKAGLIGLTKAAARELGRKGITVNAVAPGMVMTEMAKALPSEIIDQAIDESAMKELALPEDIAAAVAFLASNAARKITGQVLQVDAGQYI